MASFTETATLKVVDQSSKEIRAINRDLAKLFKTADRAKKSLKGFGSVKINTGQISLANRSLQGLQRTATKTQKSLQLMSNVRMQPLATGIRSLKQMELQARATANAVAGIGRGANGRIRGGGRMGPPGGGGSVTVQYGGLQSFLNGFVGRLGSTIESSIISGFSKGARGVDLAQNRQKLITPAQRAQNNLAATEIANRNPQFARYQVLATMGEVAPAVGNDPTNTATVTEMLLQYSKALMVAGATSEQATDNLQKLSKALGMTSTLLDQNGNFDRQGTQNFVDVIVQETITGGREMTPELIAQLAKYSRTTGKTLNQEGWRTLLFLGEDYGSSAGVGLNQMVKQLTGERVQKKQLARMMELGLMGSKEVKSGTVGGKIKTETVATGVVEENLLRSDPARWIRQVLFPVMKKNGVDLTNQDAVKNFVGGFTSEFDQLDPNVRAAKAAGEITSDRTATDILTTLITNIGEVEQRRRIAQERGNVDIDAIMAGSLVNQWDVAATQLVSAAGEVTNSLKDGLLPALKLVSDSARSVAAFLAGDGDGNPVAAAAAVGGAGVVGLAAYKGAKGLLGGFGLSASAVALDGSAAALTRAAIALGGSAAPTVDGPWAPGGKNKPKRSFLGKAFRGAATIGGITTAAVMADEVLLDGKVMDQGQRNVDWFLALQDAVAAIIQEKIRGDKTAEKPVDRVSETQAAIDQVKRDIAGAGPDAGAWVIAKQNELANLEQYMTSLRTENQMAAENMRTTFSEGSNTIMSGIEQGSAAFGETAGSALLGSAAAWGAAAGANFNQTLQQVTANIVTNPRPDTGQNANGAR